MKRKLLILQVLLLSYLSLIAQVRYTTTALNLRYGPGTKYGIVTTIPQGTPVTIDEDCNCKWIAVKYGNHIGYVSSRYLSQNNKNNSSVRKYSSARITSSPHYYTNVEGRRVQSPTRYNSVPAGATAICRDGTYSFSRNRRGTCSHHGGVSRWL